jgi:hypothetical protein
MEALRRKRKAVGAAAVAVVVAVVTLIILSGAPHTPPRPPPNRPSVQSVPWQLAHVNGRRVTVRWQSGTCDPSLRPQPRINALETISSVTLTVQAHVVKGGGNSICAGVGLGGTVSTTLAGPVGSRQIRSGKVTDRDR